MLQRIWWFWFWLWPKGPLYGERENRVWNPERENGFSLERNARGRRVQGIATFKKIAKEGRAKGCRLWEDIREGESKVLPHLKEIISVCVCESKEKQESFFFSRETYIRIIVIDLIIVKLFRVCLVIFSLQRESIFHVNFVFLCVTVILNY